RTMVGTAGAGRRSRRRGVDRPAPARVRRRYARDGGGVRMPGPLVAPPRPAGPARGGREGSPRLLRPRPLRDPVRAARGRGTLAAQAVRARGARGGRRSRGRVRWIAAGAGGQAVPRPPRPRELAGGPRRASRAGDRRRRQEAPPAVSRRPLRRDRPPEGARALVGP